MPEEFAGKTFYTREEWEDIHDEKLPPIPTETERLARRAAWAARAESAPPIPAGSPTYMDSPAYRDDLVGTEFEGWTRDPATGEWLDAHGRPAYDTHGQRINYPGKGNQ